MINNKLWAGTQNVVSEPIGFTPRGYYLFNLGSNPDFKIVTVGFKPTLILGLNVFTCNSLGRQTVFRKTHLFLTFKTRK